ncbi:phage scaffolding protein [Clostridium botulinum]|uniref:phage scaffolding protein n=1 Tax=Clostridium botulinum TaxID=1491 RepID=UPI00249F66B1|nr:phage scaffolding protein [Clostridium botulinum]MDU4596451.1 phage scaffolding protein [Clostridium sporogenes]WGZ48088.1 phage scaffold protein [Clostridium botulinum]
MPKLSEILGESYLQIPEDIRTKYKDIDLVDSSGYVEKNKFDGVNNQLSDLQAQIKERDKQLKDLSSKVGDNEELKNQIEELQNTNKTAKEEYEGKISKMQFNYAIEKTLEKAGAKNSKAVEALLDREKIKLDGETLIGLEDQINNLKESDPYLFGEDKIISPKPGDGKSDPGDSDLAAKIAEERNKQIQNPYEKLWS